MKRSIRRWTVGAGLAVAAVAVVVPAAAAWACLGLAGFTASPTVAQPGSTVQLKGVEFGSNPVQVHLDALDGPILATVTPVSGIFNQDVTLPSNLATGPHVLVATESAVTANGVNNGAANGTPARAVIQVGSAPAGVSSPARVASLATSSGSGTGTLVLVGLAVAGGGLFLAGASLFVAGSLSRRRQPAGEAING